MKLWMAVTADEYELPLCVETTAKALALSLHTSEANIRTKNHRNLNGITCGYRVVAVDDKEGD